MPRPSAKLAIGARVSVATWKVVGNHGNPRDKDKAPLEGRVLRRTAGAGGHWDVLFEEHGVVSLLGGCLKYLSTPQPPPFVVDEAGEVVVEGLQHGAEAAPEEGSDQGGDAASADDGIEYESGEEIDGDDDEDDEGDVAGAEDEWKGWKQGAVPVAVNHSHIGGNFAVAMEGVPVMRVDALHIFEAFLPKEFLEQSIVPAVSEELKAENGRGISMTELGRWMGVTLLITLHPSGNRAVFWSKDPPHFLKAAAEAIGKVMSARRYEAILRCLRRTLPSSMMPAGTPADPFLSPRALWEGFNDHMEKVM